MNKIPIGTVAEMLGVNIQTLRRWDKNKVLKPNRSEELSHRFYTEEKLEEFLSNNYEYLEKTSRKWAFNEKPTIILNRFHCPDRSIFKARLSKLSFLLSKDKNLNLNYKSSMIISVIGEIGNNSFDHNLGSWEDEIGIFFGYNLAEKRIILADRGQGLLKTLKRVRPKLSTHESAIKVAFTEYVSGRAPESRGNGLKYVRRIIETETKTLELHLQSGNAEIRIKRDSNFEIKKVENFNKGCFTILSY